MSEYFSEKIEKTPTNTGFCIVYETIRTLETLPDTKNNPERVLSQPTLSI